jgi:hypothetical protein
MNTTRIERETEATQLVNAMGAFELLRKFGKQYDDPILAIATDIIRKLEPGQYTDEDLKHLILIVGEMFDEYNSLLILSQDRTKKRQQKHETLMRDRYLEEYKHISRMGSFPW